mmetsp:Transcript_28464/g.44837  ORF Transcript_28464/g.44837 Transcript_28464/m.44837 type:complete len:82 (+) Transcript_28464:160-405(+)
MNDMILILRICLSLVDVELNSLNVKLISKHSTANMITFVHRSQISMDSCKNPMYKTMNDCGKTESKKKAVNSGTLSSSTPL